MAALPISPRRTGDVEAIARSVKVPEAFTPIFDRHFVAIHQYLARRVGRERADDLAAQTFTVAFERRASFRPDATDVRPWLYGIATKLLANHRRTEQRLLETIGRLGAQPDIVGGTDESDWELAKALARLGPRQRDVLLLHAWGELSYEEIAESLAIPLGTVRSRLARARTALRADLAVTAIPTKQEAS